LSRIHTPFGTDRITVVANFLYYYTHPRNIRRPHLKLSLKWLMHLMVNQFTQALTKPLLSV